MCLCSGEDCEIELLFLALSRRWKTKRHNRFYWIIKIFFMRDLYITFIYSYSLKYEAMRYLISAFCILLCSGSPIRLLELHIPAPVCVGPLSIDLRGP